MVQLSALVCALVPATLITAAAVPVADNNSTDSGGQVHTDIYGGTLVEANEFHALVRLEISVPGGLVLCGGTLVSKNLVVTAAHCVQGHAANTIKVRVGTHDLNSGGTLSSVTQAIVNPAFKGAGDGDIALLKLSQSFSQTPQIGYAKLPAQGSDPQAGDPGEAAGWGLMEGGSLPNRAYKTSLTFVSRDECRARDGTITDTAICAGGESTGHSTCNGDSGGPLLNLRNGNFVGITSAGVGDCGNKVYPDIFTRVGYYVDWINSHK